MGLTCGPWSLIGFAACCVLSYRDDLGGARALQFISTLRVNLSRPHRLGAARAGADYRPSAAPLAHIFLSVPLKNPQSQ